MSVLARKGRIFARRLLRLLAGPGFAMEHFAVRTLAKHFVLQKIFGFNRHVPWPVHWSTKVVAVDGIERGTRSPGLSVQCYLDGRNGIVFGENVWVGPRVSVISMNHELDNYERYSPGKPIVIGRNSWLGANAIILPEVELGEHTVVAAGAVVTKSFPDGNQVLGGNPARIIKQLGDYDSN